MNLYSRYQSFPGSNASTDSGIPFSGQLGDYKLEDLSGPEVLLRPGNESGQTKLIRRGNIIECHQWNGMETRWEKVGEVVGSAGTEGASRQSNKQTYNGKVCSPRTMEMPPNY
ncbi:PREDICTED: phospholipase A-2-activating protein-like [Acropora digitifera]|uniref:phospholipase A-2-activating protein-like n=1 Tax=Acropora digitifera TaxID=70779 RepID=UPI00077AF6A2|nr:PREDICTED: phospholipase A-2-activating protein-like [Acropora digitifera]